MDKKNVSKIKTILFIIGFAMTVQTLGFAIIYKANFTDQHIKSLQISTLIEEVGDLKHKNSLLIGKIQNDQSALKELQTGINDLAQKFSNFNQLPENETSNVKKKISQLNWNLNKNIVEKNNVISELSKQPVHSSAPGRSQNLSTFLILGENNSLTDTIILAVINKASSKITLISIPRDLYIGGRKINEYYQKFGIEESKNILQKVTGLKINHYLKVNLDASTKVIDMLGGLDIVIEKDLTDEKYPDGQNGYTTVTFKKGLEHMNGKRALEYARSRKSTSDFDRSIRQQHIIVAIRQKLSSLDLTANLQNFSTIFQTIQKNIKTDLNLLDLINLYNENRSLNLSIGNVLNTQNFLYSSKTSEGSHILLPKNDLWNEIQTLIEQIV